MTSTNSVDICADFRSNWSSTCLILFFAKSNLKGQSCDEVKGVSVKCWFLSGVMMHRHHATLSIAVNTNSNSMAVFLKSISRLPKSVLSHPQNTLKSYLHIHVRYVRIYMKICYGKWIYKRKVTCTGHLIEKNSRRHWEYKHHAMCEIQIPYNNAYDQYHYGNTTVYQ